MAALIAVAIADSAYTTYPVKGYEYVKFNRLN